MSCLNMFKSRFSWIFKPRSWKQHSKLLSSPQNGSDCEPRPPAVPETFVLLIQQKVTLHIADVNQIPRLSSSDAEREAEGRRSGEEEDKREEGGNEAQ